MLLGHRAFSNSVVNSLGVDFLDIKIVAKSALMIVFLRLFNLYLLMAASDLFFAATGLT